MTIRLLVVDDSAFMRRIITDLAEQIQGIEVVGIARNGLDALDVIPKLNPDIITLDIEMPKLNGIDTLKRIKADYEIPVIMLSSLSGTDITIEALEQGAVDFIEKPRDLNANLGDFKLELEMKIKSVIEKKSSNPFRNISRPARTRGAIAVKDSCLDVDVVVIGASTGGPKVLTELIKNLPGKINVPIFIVQHMPKGFTTSFAQRLDKESKIEVVEAKDNMDIERGKVYLAPGDYHMLIDRNKIRLNMDDKIHGVRPAVDYLFDSATKNYGGRILGIMLTGMGKDGTEGMKAIKAAGGFNIAQSEESSVVYGMPGSAVASGAVDVVLDIDEISANLNKAAESKKINC